MAEAEKAPETGSEGKSSKAGLIVGAALVALNLAGLGAGAFLAYQATLGFQPPILREPQALEDLRKEREVSAEKGEPILYSLDPLTVNLLGTKRQMIRVKLTLRMMDHDGFEEVVARNPAARDAIVRILNQKTFADVESIQGKLYLKDQIAVALNGFLKRGVVKDIYFSDFVVQ